MHIIPRQQLWHPLRVLFISHITSKYYKLRTLVPLLCLLAYYKPIAYMLQPIRYKLSINIQINGRQVFAFKNGIHSGQIHLIYRTVVSAKYDRPFLTSCLLAASATIGGHHPTCAHREFHQSLANEVPFRLFPLHCL